MHSSKTLTLSALFILSTLVAPAKALAHGTHTHAQAEANPLLGLDFDINKRRRERAADSANQDAALRMIDRRLGVIDPLTRRCRWALVQTNPKVTYTPDDSRDGYTIAPSGEVYLPVTDEQREAHADAHEYTPIVSAKIPPFFEVPSQYSVQDYALTLKDLVVLNPAPDEFLWVMEGKRHGYEGLTIVITDTQPGNGAPLHTHPGEESHVLLHGSMRYLLGDEEFVIHAPYIVNIPAMVPHAFMNVDEDSAQLVGIFPGSNQWSYDVLAGDPFGKAAAAREIRNTSTDLCDRNPERYRRRWFDAIAGEDGQMPSADDAQAHFNLVSAWHQPEHRTSRHQAHQDCLETSSIPTLNQE